MYIPKKLITHKYYIALRETKAVSSWRSLEEALICMERFKEHAPYEFSKIKGVIKVSSSGREWISSEALTELLKI
jgi:hypothetical protein